MPMIKEVIHVSHQLNEDIHQFDDGKCVSDFNWQSNMFFAQFEHSNSHVRNVLCSSYCTEFI